MRAHTELFETLTQIIQGDCQIIPALLKSALLDGSKMDYQTYVDLLREVNDAQFNIISNYDNTTGYWVRDATRAQPLRDRHIQHDAPVIVANNALLRGVSRLRGIDFALQKKAEIDSDNVDIYHQQQIMLRKRFAEWTESLLELANNNKFSKKKFSRISKKLEQQFNNILLSALYEANLTKDCYSKKDAEELLGRYRKLSALLTPARPLALLSYDQLENIIVREMHFPVTIKTDNQKQAIQALASPLLYPSVANISVHTSAKLALQEADALFVDVMLEDDTLLPSIARTDYVAGVKNAFLVKIEVCQVDNIAALRDTWFLESNIAKPQNTLWIGRASSPVYHGSFESDASIFKHTRNNIKQLESFFEKKIRAESANPDWNKRLHICSLNTAVRHRNEDQVIKFLQAAQYNGNTKAYSLSYLPCNDLGTFHRLKIDPGLVRKAPYLSQNRTISQKANRVDQIVEVLRKIYKQDNEIALIQCFGGVDRTMTIIYAFLQAWLIEKYGQRQIRNIPYMLANGGNPAEMASYLCPGSPGMLPVTKSNNFAGKRTFSRAIDNEYYRASAEDRKKNQVSNYQYLQLPSQLQRKEYQCNLTLFVEALKRAQTEELKGVGIHLLQAVKVIAKDDGGDITSRKLVDISLLLQVGAQAICNPSDTNNIEQLFALSKKLNRESSAKIWRSLATTCLALSFVALIVVGALSSISTGGLSLALTGIGCLGLASLAAKKTYSVMNGHDHFCASFFRNKERRLAKNLSFFAEEVVDAQSDNSTTSAETPLLAF